MKIVKWVAAFGIGFAVAALVRWMLGDSEPTPGGNVEGLTKNELYRRAQAADISGRSKMTKAQLTKALRATEATERAPLMAVGD